MFANSLCTIVHVSNIVIDIMGLWQQFVISGLGLLDIFQQSLISDFSRCICGICLVVPFVIPPGTRRRFVIIKTSTVLLTR